MDIRGNLSRNEQFGYWEGTNIRNCKVYEMSY